MNQKRQEQIIRAYFYPSLTPGMVEHLFDRFALQSKTPESLYFNTDETDNDIIRLRESFLLLRSKDRVYRIVERLNCKDSIEFVRFWFDRSESVWYGEYNDKHPAYNFLKPDVKRFGFDRHAPPAYGISPVETSSRIVRLLDAIDKLLKR